MTSPQTAHEVERAIAAARQGWSVPIAPRPMQDHIVKRSGTCTPWEVSSVVSTDRAYGELPVARAKEAEAAG